MKQRFIVFSFILIVFISVFQTNAEGMTTTSTGPTAPSTTTARSAPTPTSASDITAKCKLTSAKNQKLLKNLTDDSIYTVWKSGKNSTLTIRCPKEIGSLYIKWDRSPVTWTLTSDENTETNPLYKGDQNSFLHEFVALKTPNHSITLNFGEQEGTIADIYVFTPGTVPSWVQQWQPMLQKSDILMYVAHADDEVLWMGGTLPVYAGQEHKKVQVAYLIHHGAARNEYFRNHELLDGLWTVGVTNYPMISNFEDYYTTDLQKAINIYGEDNVMNYTVMLLRRFRPDVVISHDINGEYGHGVHKLCAYALQKAIFLSGDPSAYPGTAQEYGTWNIKKCYLHLYKKNQIIMDWNKHLSAFGGKTGLEMAKLGYKCHISQQKKWFRVADKGSPYDSRKFGLYYSAVGPDVKKNDFLENTWKTGIYTTTTDTSGKETKHTAVSVVTQSTSLPSYETTTTTEPEPITGSQRFRTTAALQAGGPVKQFHMPKWVLIFLICLYSCVALAFGILLVLFLRRGRHRHKKR